MFLRDRRSQANVVGWSPPARSGPVDIPIASGDYTVRRYDTRTAAPLPPSTIAAASGVLSVPITGLTSDTVFRYEPSGAAVATPARPRKRYLSRGRGGF